MMHRIKVSFGNTGLTHLRGLQPDGWVVQSNKGKILVCKYRGKYPKFKFEVFDNIQEGTIVIDTNDGYVAYRHKEMQALLDYYGIDKTYKIGGDDFRIKVLENLDGSFNNQIYAYNDIEFVGCVTKYLEDDKITNICSIRLLSENSFIFMSIGDYKCLYHRSNVYHLARDGYLLNLNNDLTKEFRDKAFSANFKEI